jgi:hypothetical protein
MLHTKATTPIFSLCRSLLVQLSVFALDGEKVEEIKRECEHMEGVLVEYRKKKPKGRVSDTALRLWWEISGGGEMTAQSFSVLPGILWSKVDYYYLHACALNSLSTS